MINWSIVLSAFVGGWLVMVSLSVMVVAVLAWQYHKNKKKMKGVFDIGHS